MIMISEMFDYDAWMLQNKQHSHCHSDVDIDFYLTSVHETGASQVKTNSCSLGNQVVKSP